MTARAFTNVYKYFSLPACQTCTCVEQAPPLSNFKGAAKRAAAANFVGCQILKAAAILKRHGSCIETFKGAANLTAVKI